MKQHGRNFRQIGGLFRRNDRKKGSADMWKKAALAAAGMAAVLSMGVYAQDNGGAYGCAPCCAAYAADAEKASESRELVVYFSAFGNTREAAEIIAANRQADIWEIRPEEPYTLADLNSRFLDSRISREHDDPSIRPAISGTIENWDDYDVVYLGYPLWWDRAPNILYTFVESYDFKGKTVIPFAVSASGDVGESDLDLRNHADGGCWQGGTGFDFHHPEDLCDWLSRAAY